MTYKAGDEFYCALCGYEFRTCALSSATVRLSNFWTPPYLVAEQLEALLIDALPNENKW